MQCRTPACFAAAIRLRVPVSKKCSTALSSNKGEFDTSTTMSAPASAGCRPSPVTALTPLLGDACSTSWPRARSRGANFEPIRPVPPMITIFISSLLCLKPRHPALHHQADLQGAGAIPRYMNPERGFATNIMFGPPAVDPKLIAELDKYRRNTDGARDKMNQVKATLAGAIEDSAAVGSSIDALNSQFAALRAAIDKALTGPAEARRDAAKKIVSD